MTLQDIALFKIFIESNTLRDIYLRGYRKSATFSKNPSSVESFLSNVEPEDAISKGITCYSINSHFGFDFWQQANSNWLEFLYNGRKRHSYQDNQKLIELSGMFKVLRENWDAAKAWLYEDIDKALIRLGLMNPEPAGEEVEEKEEEELPDINDFSGVPEYDDELEFFDVGAGSRCRTNRLRKGQASLNFRSHSFKVTFNQDDSKKLHQNGYKYVRLAKNKQGDIVIQMHKMEGISNNPVSLTFNSYNGNNNATINSKDLCEKLKVLLDLTGDYFLLKIEELYIGADKANFKISK